jgi:hypothetical protein
MTEIIKEYLLNKEGYPIISGITVEENKIDVGKCFICGKQFNTPYDDFCNDHAEKEQLEYFNGLYGI